MNNRFYVVLVFCALLALAVNSRYLLVFTATLLVVTTLFKVINYFKERNKYSDPILTKVAKLNVNGRSVKRLQILIRKNVRDRDIEGLQRIKEHYEQELFILNEIAEGRYSYDENKHRLEHSKLKNIKL